MNERDAELLIQLYERCGKIGQWIAELLIVEESPAEISAYAGQREDGT